ncbi:DUF2238 domain-containing protein [Thiomonas sp.]|uniref:DUF2238 domain-containing protein n=1 Tax=Thiomonas sp. TaxID=2047785 RepID=UPI0039B87C12
MQSPSPKLPLALGALVLLALSASAISPYDRGTWLLEVAPVLIALPVLAWTWQRFPLTPLLYWLIAAHALVLILGGAYTYARVPLGDWMREAFHLARNPYDKLGHFMQGLVPALVSREILLRGRHVAGRRMAGFLSVCVALAISAFYELIEWWTALALGGGAIDFLGTQGDPWDTQSDLFLALIGATLGLLLLGRWQDRQIARLAGHRVEGTTPCNI